jgi:hypothetical protein
MINGTLIARGTASDPINFNGGFPMQAGSLVMLQPDFGAQIVFEPSSTSWNSQTKAGCIVENAIVQSLVVNGGSPKISHSSLLNIDVFGGSAEISDNEIIGGIGVYSGPTNITNNTWVIGVVATVYSPTLRPKQRRNPGRQQRLRINPKQHHSRGRKPCWGGNRLWDRNLATDQHEHHSQQHHLRFPRLSHSHRGRLG